IPNLDQVYRHLKGLYYEPKKTYSVPYLWGTTGIGYNSDVVQTPPESWQALFDERSKGKISLLNDEREVFAMALRTEGLSINSTDTKMVAAAKVRLLTQTTLIKTYTSEN